MTFGALSLSFGFPAAYHLLREGISGDDYTGLLATAAGATLLLSGPVILWRSRTRGGRLRRSPYVDGRSKRKRSKRKRPGRVVPHVRSSTTTAVPCGSTARCR